MAIECSPAIYLTISAEVLPDSRVDGVNTTSSRAVRVVSGSPRELAYNTKESVHIVLA